MYKDPSLSLAQYYTEKYGPLACEKLEQDAQFCAEQNDLQRRNRLLRVRDVIILEGMASLS
ncbi:MAG: hypothetical protein ABJN40_01165 [Sneathiella sp.]